MREALARVESAAVGRPGGERVQRSIARWSSPPRIAVAGRPGVGKSAVVDALGPIRELTPIEVHGVDSPDVPDARLDADLLFYVIVKLPHPADLEALAGRRSADTVVVLAKADTLADRDEAAARARAATSLPVVAIDTRNEVDASSLRAVGDAAVERLADERSRLLIAELEAAAAAEPSVREAVETFLRDRPRP
jgi:tRNA U34 5-carboxymethylaminomethyl modifying GTPase MnmE/TrmE